VLVRPLNNLALDIAATYQSTKDKKNEGRDAAYSPELTANVKAPYSFWKGMTVAVFGNYVGEMQPHWDSAPVDVTDPNSPPKGRFGEKTPSYVNLAANLRIPNIPIDNMYVAVNVTNIMDEDIYFPTTQNSTWAPKGTLDFWSDRDGFGRIYI